jgi:predicted N-acyltransferase
MICTEARSIREIDEQRWDTVTSAILPMTHRWLRVVEASWRFYEPRYLLLEDDRGPCATVIANTSVSLKDLGLLGWLYHRLSLVIRPPFSSMCSIVVRPDTSLERVMAELEPALNQLRQKEKRLLITVGNVSASDLPAWQQTGFLADSQTGVSVIDLPPTYDQYLESLHRKDRQELRRIRKRAAEFDVRFEIGPLGNDTAEIYSLLCEVYAKHGTSLESMPFTPQLFTNLEHEMPEEVLVIRGYAGGKLAGVSINLLGDSMFLGQMIGLHYEIARPSFLYFLLQDEAIRWSIQHGLQRLYVGRTNEREKQKHGFYLEERWLCYRASAWSLNLALAAAMPLIQRFSQASGSTSLEIKTDKSNEMH